MGLREEISKISALKNVGLALVDYVESLSPGISFKLKGRRWVPSVNFVTFTVQHARAQNIVISLRGNPKEFLKFDELPLRKGMGYGAYTECSLKNPSQLTAVAMCIKRAHELYREGRTRGKKTPKVIES
jgi:hypothetical protein